MLFEITSAKCYSTKYSAQDAERFIDQNASLLKQYNLKSFDTFSSSGNKNSGKMFTVELETIKDFYSLSESVGEIIFSTRYDSSLFYDEEAQHQIKVDGVITIYDDWME
jgi:hypothetical protein